MNGRSSITEWFCLERTSKIIWFQPLVARANSRTAKITDWYGKQERIPGGSFVGFKF